MNPVDEVGLGKTLQKARQAAGLTQQQLCQRANLSYSTLAKIERGAIKAPSIFTIQSIANTLGVSLNELMGMPEKPSEVPKKRSRSGVRFVYFDINGCLVRFYHRAFTEVAEVSGKPADVVETTFWHYNDPVCRGDMPMEDFNRILGETFGMENFDWRYYYMRAIDPIDEMSDLVAWACENYYVGLLSNIMPWFIREMLDAKILPDAPYHSIIDSSEVGSIKPEPKIYEIAQEKAGVAPNEILLVDDSRSNLMAAERAGWKVLWFDDYRPSESVERVRTALEPAEESQDS
jgi:FMN phosphatase YigB (HAD superfamily)/DNA-binding XRE family transcriptional regulator